MLVRFVLAPAFGLMACAFATATHFGAPSGTPNQRSAMSTEKPYPYVYVLKDGTARELHPDERTYLETEFTGGDGNMPYIKDSYAERNGWGEIAGFLARAQLPRGTPIAAAPAENPNKPMNREETIAWLRAKGAVVVENPDGSFTVEGKMPR